MGSLDRILDRFRADESDNQSSSRGGSSDLPDADFDAGNLGSNTDELMGDEGPFGSLGSSGPGDEGDQEPSGGSSTTSPGGAGSGTPNDDPFATPDQGNGSPTGGTTEDSRRENERKYNSTTANGLDVIDDSGGRDQGASQEAIRELDGMIERIEGSMAVSKLGNEVTTEDDLLDELGTLNQNEIKDFEELMEIANEIIGELDHKLVSNGNLSHDLQRRINTLRQDLDQTRQIIDKKEDITEKLEESVKNERDEIDKIKNKFNQSMTSFTNVVGLYASNDEELPFETNPDTTDIHDEVPGQVIDEVSQLRNPEDSPSVPDSVVEAAVDDDALDQLNEDSQALVELDMNNIKLLKLGERLLEYEENSIEEIIHLTEDVEQMGSELHASILESKDNLNNRTPALPEPTPSQKKEFKKIYISLLKLKEFILRLERSNKVKEEILEELEEEEVVEDELDRKITDKMNYIISHRLNE